KVKNWMQVLIIIIFSLCSTGVVYGESLFTINSKEVGQIADHLSMEGHSEHDIATCTTKQRYYTEITEMLNDGYEEQEILDHYESMYGEQGFREPKRSGFSLLAWTIPFIVLGGAGGILITRLKKQAAVQTAVEVPADEVQAEEDDVIRNIIEEEKRKRL